MEFPMINDNNNSNDIKPIYEIARDTIDVVINLKQINGFSLIDDKNVIYSDLEKLSLKDENKIIKQVSRSVGLTSKKLKELYHANTPSTKSLVELRNEYLEGKLRYEALISGKIEIHKMNLKEMNELGKIHSFIYNLLETRQVTKDTPNHITFDIMDDFENQYTISVKHIKQLVMDQQHDLYPYMFYHLNVDSNDIYFDKEDDYYEYIYTHSQSYLDKQINKRILEQDS